MRIYLSRLHILTLNIATSIPLRSPQAAINAMNLEQQLSQYAFFSQQPSSQTHKSQQVSFPAAVSAKANSPKNALYCYHSCCYC